jgi:GntR family transcriptional regulator, transcriptional repressor for pyruvate dehydrogenase complex
MAILMHGQPGKWQYTVDAWAYYRHVIGMAVPKRPLVQQAAERLRDLLFAVPADTRLGALPELARKLGVGIVTVQQAARILEHEGLLEVRRGPGGGYYGTRPDDTALERAINSYMRVHPSSFEEALDITSLLFNELPPAAAECRDEQLREELRCLARGIDTVVSGEESGAFEGELQDLLFRMVDRPLFEVLTRVTLAIGMARGAGRATLGRERLAQWKAGRHRIIAAILAHDPDLARFEANRSNRRAVLQMLGRGGAAVTSP